MLVPTGPWPHDHVTMIRLSLFCVLAASVPATALAWYDCHQPAEELQVDAEHIALSLRSAFAKGSR